MTSKRQRSAQPTHTPGHAGESQPDFAARKRIRRLWQMGDLFHATWRYPRKRGAPRVDRLAGILKSGLVAPAACQDGSVCPDLSIVATGYDVPYDSLIFLHRYGSQSYLYTICEPGRFTVFVDPEFPVWTQEAMGPDWPILCQDEVYVRDRIETDRLLGIALHPADAESVLREFIGEFQRLQLPVYDYEGNVLWPVPEVKPRSAARRG